MQRGGARPGAGNKKGNAWGKTKAEKAEIELLKERLAPYAAGVAAALADKALTGDIPAIKEFHERYIGKVKEPIDVTSADMPIILPALLIAKNNLDYVLDAGTGEDSGE